jgi:hypothetical protein
MRSPLSPAPLARLLPLALLVAVPCVALHAQEPTPPIKRALYVALGGDPISNEGAGSHPLAFTAGIEQGRLGSRWSFRLGADYRRLSSHNYSDARWEDFGVALSARYGRASGAVRPYVLGGAGIAQLRTRVRGARYYFDPNGIQFPPYSYDDARVNGSLITGVGTDVTVGRVKLFTEVRANLYPAWFSSKPHRGTTATKALFFGVKF